MGKNKNRNRGRRTARNTPKPAPAPRPAPAEPTAEQLDRLATAEQQVEAVTGKHGAPAEEGVAESALPTLEECLARAEGLLASARGHFENAREKEAAAAEEQKRLTSQKRAQDASLRKRKKDVDAELAALREAAEGELAANAREVEQSELELLQRIEAVEQREEAARDEEARLNARDAELAEQSSRLTERELNAEQGFVVEKARVLKPVEEEVTRLRTERDQLEAEIASRRQAAEEDARAAAAERAEKWAAEDAERTERQAESRRQLDAGMAGERQSKLDALRTELKAERKKAEAEWEAERASREQALEAREAKLDERAGEMVEKDRALRGSQADLHADQEMLAEDRAALDRKVERLVAERTEDLRHEVGSLRKQLEDARSRRDAYFADLESRRELDRRFGDREPEELLSDLNRLERERDELAAKLRQRPDAGATERLVVLERERSEWLEERAVLQGDLASARGELATRRLAAIELEAVKKQKEALEIHKQLLDGAVDELRARVDELTRQEDHRNPMTALTSLDEREDLQSESRTTTPLGRKTPDLRAFADDLRHRIATGVKGRTLYYAERDVRAFLGGLAMTRLLLLQGISGTGKTSLPMAFASAVDGGIEIVEVQAGWRDRQDLVGYYNAFHRHYYATNFLQALYRAGTPAYRDRLFMMVLDEINLSRPEQFFADFLSALEQPMGGRRLTLVNDPVTNAPRLVVDGRHLPIPPNVWFVGTANHDETTAEFADKTYDRAHVMEMPRKTEAAHFEVEARGRRNPISYGKLETAFADAADSQAAAVKKATAWLRKAPFAATLGQRFRVGWGNRLEQQLARYLPVVVEAGGTVGEAMDHLLLTKVLRKLKHRHDVRATALEELNDQLLTAWDKLDKTNPPERCVGLIDNEIAVKKGEELV